MAYIIAADEIKKMLPGYTPGKSELFHRESARLADKKLEQALKNRSEKTVVIMAGGAASGKTEYVATYLEQCEMIVFDGTLPTFEGARIKTRKINQVGKRAEIHLVLPDSLHVAFVVFSNRARKFPWQHFYRTHSGSRKATLKIAEECPGIAVRIFISEASPVDLERAMNFKEIIFSHREELIEYLRDKQYNEEDIRKKVMQS